MLVIDGTATILRGNRLVLYGRTNFGESIEVHTEANDPYLYVERSSPIVLRLLQSDEIRELVRSYTLCQRLASARVIDCVKIFCRYPSHVRKLAQEFERHGLRTFGTDLNFFFQNFLDHDWTTEMEVTGLLETSDVCDLRMKVDPSDLQRIEGTEIRPSVLSIDIENDIDTGEILCVGYVFENPQLPEAYLEGTLASESNEEQLLNDLQDLIWRLDPDVISGYNVIGYDIVHIIERARKLNCESALRWGRDRAVIRADLRATTTKNFLACHGRVGIDVWAEVKKHLRPDRESLGYVAEEFLQQQKIEFDVTNLGERWKDPAERARIQEYCLQDTRLSHRLLAFIDSISKVRDLAIAAKCPMSVTALSFSSRLIDSLVIRVAEERHILIPQARRMVDEEETEHIVGGYVRAIEPGVYRNVGCFDFKSMYPSIIIKDNICYTTFNAQTKTFCPPADRIGIMPQILRDLMARRNRMKQLQTPYGDAMSDAIKILMNSFYGVMASPYYRFNNPEIAAEITQRCRDAIHRVISFLEQQDVRVIYSDTDSIFLSFHTDTVEASLQEGQTLIERCNELESLDLEFQAIYRSFFSHGKKKKYAALQVWPVEKMIIKGYETVRTDSFRFLTESMQRVFELILADQVDEAKQYARERVFRLFSKKVDPLELTISKSCQKFSFYKNPDSVQQVRAAKRLIEYGETFHPGMKISWIIVPGVSRNENEIEPMFHNTYRRHDYDIQYYAERVAKALGRILEPLGMDENRLLERPNVRRKRGISELLGEQTVLRPSDRSSVSDLL